nr:hypothetical protein [Tanacetum cinerariifolium]
MGASKDDDRKFSGYLCVVMTIGKSSNEVLPAGMKTCQQKQNTRAAGMTIPNNPSLNWIVTCLLSSFR